MALCTMLPSHLWCPVFYKLSRVLLYLNITALHHRLTAGLQTLYIYRVRESRWASEYVRNHEEHCII